jgi:hypothetical protein
MPGGSITRLRGRTLQYGFTPDERDSQYAWRMLESDPIILMINGQCLPPPTHRPESLVVSMAEELVDGE